MEQENLNEQNQEVAQQEESNSESPKTYTAEEYQELERKYNASTKEAQKLSWISKVAVDNTKFIKLYNSDKRQAEEVAKHFGRSAKELYEQVKAEYWEGSIDVEDIDERAEKIADKKFAEKSLKDFKDKYGISWKLDKTFTTEFEWLMDGKDWESEEVLKQAKRALKLIRDTDEFQNELNKANSRLAGAWITWSTRADNSSNADKWPYANWKEQEAKQSIFGEYGKSKDY